jgi:hypothetical protein
MGGVAASMVVLLRKRMVWSSIPRGKGIENRERCAESREDGER